MRQGANMLSQVRAGTCMAVRSCCRSMRAQEHCSTTRMIQILQPCAQLNPSCGATCRRPGRCLCTSHLSPHARNNFALTYVRPPHPSPSYRRSLPLRRCVGAGDTSRRGPSSRAPPLPPLSPSSMLSLPLSSPYRPLLDIGARGLVLSVTGGQLAQRAQSDECGAATFARSYVDHYIRSDHREITENGDSDTLERVGGERRVNGHRKKEVGDLEVAGGTTRLVDRECRTCTNAAQIHTHTAVGTAECWTVHERGHAALRRTRSQALTRVDDPSALRRTQDVIVAVWLP